MNVAMEPVSMTLIVNGVIAPGLSFSLFRQYANSIREFREIRNNKQTFLFRMIVDIS